MMKTFKYISILVALLCGTGHALAQTPDTGTTTGDACGFVLEQGRVIGGNGADSGARLMDPVIIDFDGDGIDDLVFGAPGYTPNGMNRAGSFYVILGRKDFSFDSLRDMTYWSQFDYRFDGHTPNGQLGMTLYTGDFNGDGKLDIAVAEPGQFGSVYIFYGGKSRDRGIHAIDDENNGADLAFVGTELGSHFGIAGCVGDFNHDGIDDLALSSISKNSTYGTNASIVTIIPMRSRWEKKSYSMSNKLNGKTVLSRSLSGNARVVHACAAADFNDDGLTDIALGMPLDSYQKQKASGSVTVIYQPYKYNGTTIDLGNLDPKHGIRINGNQTNAQFGYALAAGDVTGDGRADLIVSAPNRLVSGPNPEGAVYVFDSNLFPKDSGEQPDNAIQLTGNGGRFGEKIWLADVNADKRKDIVVAAPQAGALQSGAISIWLGGPHFVESVAQNLRPDFAITGGDFMGFGAGAAFGDIDGDGKPDAIFRLTADPYQRPATGAYAVMRDIPSLGQSTELGDNFMTIAAPTLGGALDPKIQSVKLGETEYDVWFSPRGMQGRSLICLTRTGRATSDTIALSDENACDYRIIGPQDYPIADFDFTPTPTLRPQITISVPSMPVKQSKGFVAAIPLPDEMPKTLVLNLNEKTLKSEAQTFLLSGESDANLGAKIQWADLDGDGIDDLIIGAPKRIVDADTSGSVFIVKGTASPKHGFRELKAKDVIAYDGFLNEQIGSDWQILDFNLDATPDLALVSSKSTNASGESHAVIYVLFSPATRVPKQYSIRAPEIAALQIQSAQTQTEFKFIRQTVDLDGDAASDLLFLSPNHRIGIQKQGILYAIYASKDRTGGIFDLASVAPNFSLSAGRNEQIDDVRFTSIDDKLQIIVASSDFTSGINTTIHALQLPTDASFTGAWAVPELTKTTCDARIPKRVQLATTPTPTQQLWFAYPDDGNIMTRQGIIQKVRTWNAPKKPQNSQNPTK